MVMAQTATQNRLLIRRPCRKCLKTLVDERGFEPPASLLRTRKNLS